MEASSTAPPDAFGPFRVLHQVGAGALGPVFRASDSDRGRLLAVKLFQLDLAAERMHRWKTRRHEADSVPGSAWGHMRFGSNATATAAGRHRSAWSPANRTG
jgi:hypothetical protein